jgi:hypothetical protein
MVYDLPKSLEVCGALYEIRSDYRAMLDICIALSDPELEEQEKVFTALDIFYPAFFGYEIERDGETETVLMPQEHYEDAVAACFKFIACDDEHKQKNQPKLMDWAQDFQYVVAPVNRVMGQEIRAVPYLHWWSFVSAYREIGECTFAQIVRVRDKLARGKPLDKQDREWYNQNRHMVDMRAKYTSAEDELLKKFGAK